jgi:hypothetical protein
MAKKEIEKGRQEDSNRKRPSHRTTYLRVIIIIIISISIIIIIIIIVIIVIIIIEGTLNGLITSCEGTAL